MQKDGMNWEIEIDICVVAGWLFLGRIYIATLEPNSDLSHWYYIIVLGTILLLFSHSVAQSCPAVCNPMDCSMPGFPVLHYLLEFAQTQVH